jgi:2-isopropylmalate synthase
MKAKLQLEPDQVIERIEGSVSLARNHTADVEWSAEDGSRTDPDFLCRAVETAIKAGATTINVPDTVGYAMPEDMARIFAMLIERVPGADGVIFSTHNHNDLGLAVANSLAALHACPYTTGVVSENILRTSRLLSTTTGFDVQPNKAIVGRNAFAHESGIHQDGMLKNALTYEIMTPASVGWTKSSLVLGKHSGRAAFRAKLKEIGYGDLGDNQISDAFTRFKDLADKKKTVFEEDIIALVDDAAVRDHERIRFIGLTVWTGSRQTARAHLTLEIDGLQTTAEAEGDGGVDAAFKAVRALFPHDAALRLYSVGAVTEGTDAQAKTTVRLEEDGRLVDGQGADTDTIVAAVRAYVHALNKLLVKRERREPEAMTA